MPLKKEYSDEILNIISTAIDQMEQEIKAKGEEAAKIFSELYPTMSSYERGQIEIHAQLYATDLRLPFIEGWRKGIQDNIKLPD